MSENARHILPPGPSSHIPSGCPSLPGKLLFFLQCPRQEPYLPWVLGPPEDQVHGSPSWVLAVLHAHLQYRTDHTVPAGYCCACLYQETSFLRQWHLYPYFTTPYPDPNNASQVPGVGCCCLVAKSCLTFCNPMDCSPRGSSMRFPRQEYWSGLPISPPGNLPDPAIEPAWQVDSVPLSRQGSPPGMWQELKNWLLYFSFLQINKQILKYFDINQFTQNIGTSDQTKASSLTHSTEKTILLMVLKAPKYVFHTNKISRHELKAELRLPFCGFLRQLSLENTSGNADRSSCSLLCWRMSGVLHS